MSTNKQLCQTDSTLFDIERAQGFRSELRFCDLVIQSTANDNKKFINCHKVIIASMSPFFEEILRNTTIRSLSIPNIEHETLEILIDYMYSNGGLISLNNENVFKICSGANHLKLNQLVNSCLQFIRSLVTLEDVIRVFKFSLEGSFPILSKTCITFIVDNLATVKPFGFLDLDYQQVKMVVEHGIESQTVPKSDILEAVSGWLHSNWEERQHYASTLISKIPLVEVGLKNLRKLIREDVCLKNIPEIYDVYVDAVEEIGLQLEQAQMEKRKAEELENGKNEETAVTDCEHLSQPGTSKRGRFSSDDKCTANKRNKTDQDNSVAISLGIHNIDANLANIGREKTAVVYFVSEELIGTRFQHAIVSYNLETRNKETLGSNLNFQSKTSLVYHKHKIYSFGHVTTTKGCQRNPVPAFNILTKRWEHEAPDHVEVRAGFRTIVLDNYLYTIGGSDQAGESSDVERLKIEKPYKKWEKVAKVPLSSCGFGICVANGSIYVLGGNTFVLSRLTTIHNNVVCYTPENNEWVNKQHMPKPRRGFAVAVVGRYIYALGGSTSAVGKDDHVSTVDIYDTELDTWKKGISMNQHRQFFSAIVYNNCIYALGGDSGDSPTMERFNIVRQVWEDMGSLPECGFYHSVDLHVEEL